nr:hypothetical protein [Bosea vaviloviae]
MLLDLEAGGFRGLEIDRDGVVHIEQGGLHDRADLGCAVGCACDLAAKAVLGPAGDQHIGDDLLEDQRIATNIPARLKADAGMDLAHRGDGGDIVLVELAAGDAIPMRGLALLGGLDVLFAAEETLRLRRIPELRIEGFESPRQRGDDVVMDAVDLRSRLGIELHEGQAAVEVIRR